METATTGALRSVETITRRPLSSVNCRYGMSTVLTSSATGATFCDGAAGSGDESGRKPRTMPIPRLRNQLATMPGPFAEVARTIAAPTGVVTRHRTHGACLTEPGEARTEERRVGKEGASTGRSRCA